MTHKLSIDPSVLQEFCRRYEIIRLSPFGSVLRGEDHPNSDVDLLVEFAADAMPTLMDLAQMELELSSLLNNRKVDLRTPRELSCYFRDDVQRHAEVQYVA